MAHGILDNFEISLAVLLPNTTTSHVITYTNSKIGKKDFELYPLVLSAKLLPWLVQEPSFHLLTFAYEQLHPKVKTRKTFVTIIILLY